MKRYFVGLFAVAFALVAFAFTNNAKSTALVNCDTDQLYWFKFNSPSCSEDKAFVIGQIGLQQVAEFHDLRGEVVPQVECEDIDVCICYIGVPAIYVNTATGKLLTTSIPTGELCVITRLPL